MNSDLQLLINEVKNLKQFAPVLLQLEQHLATLDSSQIKEVADSAYVFRECSNAIDNIRKKLDVLCDRCQEQVHTYCLMYSEKNVNTPLCTLTPRASIVYKYPTKKKDEGWDSFMQSMLADPKVAIDNELIRPHWPGVKEYITSCLANNRKLPFGITADKFQDAELKCTIRGNKDVL